LLQEVLVQVWGLLAEVLVRQAHEMRLQLLLLLRE
jgi:hypothetical protein